MSEKQAVRTARSLVAQAQEKVNTACVVLRRNGLGEVADDLARLAKQAKVWNDRDGYLDQIERQCK
jgi:hypothetical protein